MQDAAAGTLTETTLVLSGIDESTPWFTDRPYREAGQITTAEFVALFFEEGANSFAEDPPNADFTCEVEGAVVNQAVTLTDPVLDETAGTLTYTAALVPSAGDDDSFSEITCDGDTHLFIDDTINVADFVSCGQSGLACEAAGGTWDAGTNKCTPGVTQVGCEAGGGTWDAETSTCTAASKYYSCFLAGFCSRAARDFPPATHGYTNLYDGLSSLEWPEPGAACGDSVHGVQSWAAGEANFLVAPEFIHTESLVIMLLRLDGYMLSKMCQ